MCSCQAAMPRLVGPTANQWFIIKEDTFIRTKWRNCTGAGPSNENRKNEIPSQNLRAALVATRGIRNCISGQVKDR